MKLVTKIINNVKEYYLLNNVESYYYLFQYRNMKFNIGEIISDPIISRTLLSNFKMVNEDPFRTPKIISTNNNEIIMKDINAKEFLERLVAERAISGQCRSQRRWT